MNRYPRILSHALAFALYFSIGSALALDIEDYPELEDLIQTMVKEDGYPEGELRAVIAAAKINQKTLELMDRQWEAFPWHKYMKRFVNYRRIVDGLAFWKANEAILQRAEAKYGVPASIIVSIIGIETHYGKQMGKSNVLNSLVSLTAAYPRRSQFFKGELRVFLNLARLENIEPWSVKGSFAGAIGIPQFMPSSYNHHSVDFNENGIRDLVNEVDDAIGSVANYLKNHGWQTEQAIYSDVHKTLPERALELVAIHAKPQFSVDDLLSMGIDFNVRQASDQAALVGLELDHGNTRYLVAFNNLYVITRYNNSVNYAMAVAQLAEKLEQKR